MECIFCHKKVKDILMHYRYTHDIKSALEMKERLWELSKKNEK